MTEARFIQKHLSRFEKIEREISHKEAPDPDRLVQIYAELSDDLAYAQTHFPQAEVTAYLNSLLAQMHRDIQVHKKSSRERLRRFWTEDIPNASYKHRRKLLVATLLFALSITIGALSAAHDPYFTRLILGDAYVNMTEANIQQGDPMAVYKGDAASMFARITFNNIRVSFNAFLSGLFWGVGTVLLLFYNGVMLGVFHYFFFENTLLITSLVTVWIHGTIEISAIVIAGAAGLTLGEGLLFPGTYSRLQSVQRAAGDGIRMITGLIPLFVVAGFLESYVTRLTEAPLFFKLLIIFSSAGWVLYYYGYYPLKRKRNGTASSF